MQIGALTAVITAVASLGAARQAPGEHVRIGFRFLRDLMRQYDGNEHLALLAYNRGPARVNEYLEATEHLDELNAAAGV